MRRRSALALLLSLIWPLIGSLVAAVSPAAAAPGTSAVDPRPTAVRQVPWDLRLTELDYDQPGIDDGEFVEIVNMDAVRHRLRHVDLVLVNGSTGTEYRRIPLSGRLGPTRRVVVATGTVDVDPAARTIPLPLARDVVQNGSPDAIALVDVANRVVLDALSYEGSIDDAQIEGLPDPVSLVAGHAVTESDDNEVAASLCRLPDRADTDDDDHDWARCAPTPGAPNASLAGGRPLTRTDR